jgi:hypothetical protein
MNPILTSLLFMSFVAVAPAPAQSFNFQVDFDFSVAGRPLAAGTYKMEPFTPDGVGILIRHRESGRSLFVNLPTQQRTPQTVGQASKVAFRCVHQNCEISAVHNLRPGLSYRRWESDTSKKDVYFRMVALLRAAN